jgi:hypothetical protein
LIKSPKSTPNSGIESEDAFSIFISGYFFASKEGAESKILQSSSVNTSPSLLLSIFG